MGDANLERARRLLSNVEEDAIEMLRDYIVAHGGYIKCVPEDGCDNIYCYIWNENYQASSPIDEQYVNCVMDQDGNVYFHACDYGDDFDSLEEIKDDEYNWYALDGGNQCLVRPTLDFILEAIDEYVDDENNQ